MNRYLNKVLIVDGSYMLHRALHTPAMEDLTTTKGVKSGGVYGFLRMLQSEIRKCTGYFPIVCWDKGLSERRVSLYSDYKANRKRLSADNLIATGIQVEHDEYLEEYHRQRTDLIQILKSLGIPSLIIPSWEGDDLQYLLSKVSEDSIVLSDDKDMIQLVAPNVKIRRPMKDETITWDGSDSYYHHPHYTIVKSICGDSSDNIPQVASGLGWKGADKIATILESITDCTINDYDLWKSELESYINNNSGAIVTKIKKLIDNWDQFIVNYKLTNLRIVEPPYGFETMIKDLILNTAGKSNLLRAYSLIGAYELKTIYPDQIIFSISASSSQLLKKE